MGNTGLVMQSIKIGYNEYKIEKGDYILDNGSCIQYIRERKIWYQNIVKRVPKTTAKKLPIDKMKLIEKNGCKYYYF